MLQCFFDDGLRRHSYLLACPRTRTAVVVDPRRDVDVYVEAARSLGVRIGYVFETHLHGDAASGARELLAVGASVIAGPGVNLRYAHHQAADGERLRVGDLSILFLHTPGHAPEHLSMLTSQPDQPVRLFTGDTLLTGGVGLPDGVDTEENHRLADALHDSLFRKILRLDDRIMVHPGHASEPPLDASGSPHFTTIGDEKRTNPMLRLESKADFVKAILREVKGPSAVSARLRKLNRDGPPLLGLVKGYRGPSGISPGAAAAAVRSGALVADLRTALEFAAGHPRGAVNVPAGSTATARALHVLPHDPRVVLLAADAREALEASRQLLRAGVSRIDGYISGGFAAWQAARLPTSQSPSVLSV